MRCGVLILMIFVAAGLAGADLTGRWSGDRTGPDGQVRAITFVLRQDGANLSGAMLAPMGGTMPIKSGTVSGDELTFEVELNFAGMSRVTKFTGKFVDGNIRLQSQMPNGAPAPELIAKRVSTDATLPKEDPLPPVELPPLRKLAPNGLALTPPMGWNSWNHFGAKISDQIIREAADAMVANGMKAAGYLYINIDDGWQDKRDAAGVLQPNARFPNMMALSAYVHGKGLKLGIYSSPGPKTCGGFEGSYGHEETDAKTWAEWGIDYLKYDWCSASRGFSMADQPRVYQKMAEALRAAGRPIVYGICQYGANDVGKWGAAAGGNLWRTTFDIRDTWKSMSEIGFAQDPWAPYGSPGHWNDPDMLEVGNGGMNLEEYRTHMSLWSLLAAPLLAGNDLRKVSKEHLAILTNADAIAIDQDRLGKPAKRLRTDGSQEVWTRSLSGGMAVGLFNRGDAAASVTVKWTEVGLKGKPVVRDVWSNGGKQTDAESFTAMVAAYGVVLLRLSESR